MYVKSVAVFLKHIYAMLITFYRPSAGMLLSNDEMQGATIGISQYFIDYLTGCPVFVGRFVSTCTVAGLSCNNKCGKLRTMAMMCSCDTHCLLRNDCCWDFQDQCPSFVKEISDETRKVFAGFNKTCENNFQIIEGTDAIDKGLGANFMHNNFVITDKGSGLSFRNMNVYKMHKETLIKYNMTSTVFEWSFLNNDLIIDQNLVAWDKQIINNGSVSLHLNDIKQILEYGLTINDVEIINIAPSLAEPCDQKLMLQCSNPYRDSEQCRHHPDIEVEKPELYCSYFSNVSERAPRDRCQTRFEMEERGQSEFGQVIDFFLDENDVVTVINGGLDENSNWFSISVKKDISTRLSDISVSCGPGHTVLFSDCHSPKHFVMVLSVARSNISFAVGHRFEEIVQYINEYSPSISIGDNWNVAQVTTITRHTSQMSYYSVMTFQKFLLHFQLSRKNVSEMVSDFLKKRYGETEIQEMISCLGFDIDKKIMPQNGNLNPQIDNALPESHIAAKGHITLPENVFLLCDYIIRNSTHTIQTFNVTGMDELLGENVGTLKDGGDTNSAHKLDVKVKIVDVAIILLLLYKHFIIE